MLSFLVRLMFLLLTFARKDSMVENLWFNIFDIYGIFCTLFY
jgi:hypothetical protein